MENEELKESVKESGLLEPIIVRSFSAGTYEIISGHRRVEVCKELGIKTVPAIIKVMSKDEAVIAMVDSNLQREHLLPSEKAFAYKMKLEALKHQGKATSRQLVGKSKIKYPSPKAADKSKIYPLNAYTELLKLVDEERIAFTRLLSFRICPKMSRKY